MAIANVLAIGTTAADSADITIAANSIGSFSLKKTGGGVLNDRSLIKIYRKDDLGGYNYIDRLNTTKSIISLPEGTYRFSRAAGPSVGVFQG